MTATNTELAWPVLVGIASAIHGKQGQVFLQRLPWRPWRQWWDSNRKTVAARCDSPRRAERWQDTEGLVRSFSWSLLARVESQIEA
jgi:hypothetical protein